MIEFILEEKDKNLNIEIDYNYINSLYLIQKTNSITLDDLSILKKKCENLLKFKSLIVFGIGGSCLGGKLISSFGENKNKKIKFYDTIDEAILVPDLEILNLKETAILFISKSGSTLETIIQYDLISKIYKKRIVNFQENFFFITEENSYLHDIARNINSEVFYFDKKIGGRYSCFSEASLIPALFRNTDIDEYIKGAKKCILDFNIKDDNIIDSFKKALQQVKEKEQFTLLCYSEKLEIFNNWYTQLIAESSGKNGVGVTPVVAIGTRDQHSMLQLFLDGKNDKFHTIITKKPSKKSQQLKIENEKFSYLNNHNISEILYTNSIATFNALKIKNRETRLIELKTLNTYTIGYLNMYFVIENILVCQELNVNPFDQPAVEIIKQEVKNILLKKKI